jgi:hypothetical protein
LRRIAPDGCRCPPHSSSTGCSHCPALEASSPGRVPGPGSRPRSSVFRRQLLVRRKVGEAVAAGQAIEAAGVSRGGGGRVAPAIARRGMPGPARTQLPVPPVPATPVPGSGCHPPKWASGSNEEHLCGTTRLVRPRPPPTPHTPSRDRTRRVRRPGPWLTQLEPPSLGFLP